MKQKLTVFAIITLISFNVIFAQVPAAPLASAATSITATSFTANWASGGGAAETAYYLDVSTSSSFASFVSGYNNLNVGLVTSYSVTGLTAGPTYYYRVRGYNGFGSSPNSSTIDVAGISVASAATSISNSGFTANWSAVAGASSYTLTNVVDGSSPYFLIVGTSYAVTGLTAGTMYTYSVQAVSTSLSISTASNSITVWTIPSDPVSSAATDVAGTSFSANWSASTGATGYYLDVATDAGFSSFVSGYNNLALGVVTTYSVTGLSSNTPYWYRVRAFNTGGTSGNSGTQTTTTGPLANAATLITQTSFQANWAVAAANNYLEVSTSPTFAGNIGGNFAGTFDFGVVSSTPVSGLTAGTTYYYRVSTAAATPPYSNTITVVTVPPAPVSSAASNIAGTSLSANWSSASGATGYYLDVATDVGFTSYVSGFNNLNVGNVTTYSVTGLTISTPYYYRVRAYNGSGTSGNSSTQNPTTGPAVPLIGGSSPANYAVGVTIQPSFAWSGGVSYDFQIDDNSDFSSPIISLNANPSTSYSFAPYVNTSTILLANGTTYYWRIRKFGPPNSDWTPTQEFTTVNAATPYMNPTLTGVTTAYISWHPVPYSSGLYYDLLWSASANMAGFTTVARLDTTSYTLTNLVQGTTYYVQVRAKNTAGTVIITYSSVTTPFTATAPPIPYRSYPIDGATSYALKPTFFWYIKGNEPFLDYQIRYRLSTDPYPGVPQVTTTSNKLYKTISTDLVAGSTYYWQVRSFIGGVYSNWSTIGDSSFVMYTSLASSPIVPYASWPSGGATVYVNPPVLYYYIDVYATGLEFQVQYSTSSSVGGGGDFSVSPVTSTWTTDLFSALNASLIPNQLYYWHVRSRLAATPASISAWSSTVNFLVATTASGAATTPIPSTPVGGQILDSPLSGVTLYWSAFSTQVLDFEVRIAQSSSVDINGRLDHPLATSAAWITNAATSITVTSIPYTLTAGASYYWQVRSRLNTNNLIVSPWSMVASFATAAGSSSVVPLVISPNYGQPINNTSAILTWKIPVPTETHLKYDLQYSKSADFSNAQAKTNLDEPVMQVSGLDQNSTYYWRVLSKNDNGSISNYSTTGTFKTSGATSVEGEEAIPTAFELSQNYPNPFNPTTRITYALPQNSYVTIKVYDMLGREVRTLISGEMLAGSHSVEWKGEDNLGGKVASGAYIYRITAGNFISTKKMLLLK
ncbi:MAG: fibronectin type III domain-containing protein [Ignavibacteriales bacterium]|nr:fibronectin type III domain-containing protein [Ignavibacteriales bacterium]